ncbi:hypothetical protein LGM63_30875 [Burkholderia cepacia]|uniref:hypothetical protein n=1 Tax=Burkholderia cepacia TaxID=292 RepID=UPI001CF0D8AF|nr:hypothetical protein [Burkholderia cepacia]MCA7995061.1 hypothetical protein [Burkholderia cepacia]
MSPLVKQLLEGGDDSPATRALSARENDVVLLFGAGYAVGEIVTQSHLSKRAVKSWKTSAKKLEIVRELDPIRYVDECNARDPSARGEPAMHDRR